MKSRESSEVHEPGDDGVTRAVTRDFVSYATSDGDVPPMPCAANSPGGGDGSIDENRDDVRPNPGGADPAAAEAIDALVRVHAPAIYRVAMGVLGDPALAEDVVQETVLRAWQALGSFRGEASLRTWVLRIAHNVAVSAARRRRDWPSEPDDLVGFVDDRASADVERHVDNRLAIAELWKVLATLDEASRTVLVLREIEHLSYEEIAELLGVALPTVKTRLFRARRLLAARLGPMSRDAGEVGR